MDAAKYDVDRAIARSILTDKRAINALTWKMYGVSSTQQQDVICDHLETLLLEKIRRDQRRFAL
jgi:hypothetical protein